MTRPRSNTVDYFPHMVNHGDTLEIIEGEFGNDGYTTWFKLLETLCKTENHYLDCSNYERFKLLQVKCRVDEITINRIINLLANLQAIDQELWEKERIIWSDNLVDNLDIVYKNRKRTKPLKPVSTNKKPHSKGINTSSYPAMDGITTHKKPHSIVEYSIGKESIKHTVSEIYDLLIGKVKLHRPHHKNGNKAKDLTAIRLMLERDKRNPQRVAELLEWYPIGGKYIPEIFSASALREKYDKLESAYLRKSKPANKHENNMQVAKEMFKKLEEEQNGVERNCDKILNDAGNSFARQKN